MADPYEVDPVDLRTIFDEDITELVFGDVDPYPSEERPVFVQLGGQLAAGKSSALRSLLAEHNGRLAVLSPDDFRPFHPKFDEIMRERPHEMVAATAQAMYAWSDMVREHAHEHGYGLLVEGTFRAPEYLLQYAQEAAQPVEGHEGAINKVVVIATPSERSALDMVGRYLAQPPGQGRWASIGGHDAIFAQLPDSLDQLEASPHIHQVVVTDRAGTIHYDNTRGLDGVWEQEPRAGQALREARREGEVPFDRQESQVWLASYAQYAQALIERGELNVKTAPTMLGLHAHADRIGAVAYQGQDDRLAEHARDQAVHRVVFMAGERGVPNTELPPSPQALFSAAPQERQRFVAAMQTAAADPAVEAEAAEAVRRSQQGLAPPGVRGAQAGASETVARPGREQEKKGPDLER